MVGEKEDEQYPDDERHAEEVACAYRLPVGVADHQRRAAGRQADEAAVDAHGSDGDDKRGQEQAGGEQAVHGAEDGTGDDGNEQCGGKSGAEGEALCADHSRDGNDGADGEVDFAEQDDPGHAKGGNGDDRDLLEDVHEVCQREEAAVGNGKNGAEDDEGDDDASVLAQERMADEGAVRRGHGVVLWRRP